jgi:hypothetical protein
MQKYDGMRNVETSVAESTDIRVCTRNEKRRGGFLNGFFVRAAMAVCLVTALFAMSVSNIPALKSAADYVKSAVSVDLGGGDKPAEIGIWEKIKKLFIKG